MAASPDDGPATLPRLAMTDIIGRVIPSGSLEGRVVLVEMWATWCPPCLSTMKWMNTLQRAHADRVAIIAIAVDSKDEDIRRIAADIKPAYHIVAGTPEVLKAMGTVAAVPKLFIFDRTGARAEVIYGAAPDLHDRIERVLRRLAPR